MALDVSILDSNGDPLDSVAVDEDVHGDLVSAAEVVSCGEFLRLRDYYGEVVEFAYADLPSLLDGLNAMVSQLRSPAREVANELRQLVGNAMMMKKSVHALPD